MGHPPCTAEAPPFAKTGSAIRYRISWASDPPPLVTKRGGDGGENGEDVWRGASLAELGRLTLMIRRFTGIEVGGWAVTSIVDIDRGAPAVVSLISRSRAGHAPRPHFGLEISKSLAPDARGRKNTITFQRRRSLLVKRAAPGRLQSD